MKIKVLLALFPMKNSGEREVSFDVSLSAAQDKHLSLFNKLNHERKLTLTFFSAYSWTIVVFDALGPLRANSRQSNNGVTPNIKIRKFYGISKNSQRGIFIVLLIKMCFV